MMSTANHLNMMEKTAVLHQFQSVDRNHDDAIDENEYVSSMLKAYTSIADDEFDKWVRNMIARTPKL